MAEFFARYIVVVYFFYGLSFFTMGLVVWLEAYHATELDFGRALRPLAGFGLVHGGHEWMEMFILIFPQFNQPPFSIYLPPLRLALLGASFLMLISCGMRLISGSQQGLLQRRWVMATVILLWVAGLLLTLPRTPAAERWLFADVYTRYALAIPSAVLTVWGLILQRRRFIAMDMPRFGHDVVVAALAFGLYGGVGQLFASPTFIFPSAYLNSDTFMRWFGFPIQVFRALMAMIAAVSIIRSLRAFELEDHRRMEKLRVEQEYERKRMEATRAELLHRTVKAQESERLRISRELHDEIGQTLTALALGLRALSENALANPERLQQNTKRLEGVATAGIAELQRLVGGLHPPQLDDLGLPAALRWYADQIQTNFNLETSFTSTGAPCDLSAEERVVLFRIAQEAVTNAIRHAQAQRVSIALNFRGSACCLVVCDDGRGFDVAATLAAEKRPSWGLMGMQERASLINAAFTIESQVGEGSQVRVCLRGEAAHA